MRRVMFVWRGRAVHSYPFMQYIGLNLGVLAGNAAAKVNGVNSFRFFVATVILLFPALAGARILHLVTNWNFYREHRSLIWNTREGGAAQYGGFLLAVPLSIPLLHALDVPFGAFWDLAAITMMVGMIFTRIGCLLNGCCAGHPTDSWIGVNLPNLSGVSEKRYPTQLLEALWAALLLAAGLAVWPSLGFDGALLLFIASGYALGRLALESMRESNGSRRGLTIHHAISILIIAVTLAALTVRRNG